MKLIKSTMAAVCLIFFILSIFTYSLADQCFDVRQHLSTVTRYGAVKDVPFDDYQPFDIPQGCTPIHLNLVARHGTRWPTQRRMRELDRLASHFEELVRAAEERNKSLENVPKWIQGWKSPWRGKLKGGQLISEGEEELYDLGIRTRERFPDLFKEEYNPDVYAIRATQVPRASASAVAFGMGLFSGNGSLGPGNNKAFSVVSESRANDIMLRFYDSCQNYKTYKKKQKPAINKLKEPVFDEITAALVSRYGLNFTRQDTSSLWFLCKQEASLLDITDQACGLYMPSDATLLEWTDDLEVFILKGYGKSINYRMGVPLLRDVFQSMEEIIEAQGKQAPRSYEKARLMFAHAGTVVPFTCLLGLFLEGSKIQKIRKEQSLQLPPRPPKSRNWRSSLITPFVGNNMLVLHSCPSNASSKYYVQVLHNEHPIPMLQKIISPHLKDDFNTICGKQHQKSETSKLSQLFGLLFSLGRNDKASCTGLYCTETDTGKHNF